MEHTMRDQPSEIVVATASTAAIKIGFAGVFAILLWAISASAFPVLLLVAVLAPIAFLALWVVQRMEQMSLSVNHEVVTVVNFGSRHELDTETVRIDTKRGSVTVHDDAFAGKNIDGEFKSDRARQLYLTDDNGAEAMVGLAPSYGSRLDDIAEDLYSALAVMRS